MIKQIREELEAEQARRAELERQTQENKAAAEQLEKDVQRALGTKELLEQLENKVLSGQATDQERRRLKVYRENNKFYTKLLDKARGDTRSEFAQVYWGTVDSIPGLPKQLVGGNDLSTALKNLYAAG